MYRVKHRDDDGRWRWVRAQEKGRPHRRFAKRQQARQYIRNRLGTAFQGEWVIVHPDGVKERFKWRVGLI